MNTYIQSVIKEFTDGKALADKTIAVLSDEQLNWNPGEGSNSISIIVRHITANIRSRFTDFLTSDGEKSWRNRDAEFEDQVVAREDLLRAWDESWALLLELLGTLKEEDLEQTVYIRGQAHTVIQAVNRQVAHYSYHIGQIVLIGKICHGLDWKSLSIPRGGSQAFNDGMFGRK